MSFDRFLTEDMEDTAINIEKVSSMDVAIIGISAIMPEAEDAGKFWDNLYGKKNVVHSMKKQREEIVKNAFDIMGAKYDINTFSKCAIIDNIDKFDYKFFNMSKNEAIYMDPNQRLFLQTAWNAFEDAGYGGNVLKGSDTGVYVAVNSNYAAAYSTLMSQSSKNNFQYTGSIESMISGRLSFLKDFHGPNMIIETACSSSLVCLHAACQAIRNGECRMALVGGVNVCMLPVQNDSVGIQASDGITRTFDVEASGTGVGEGVIAFVIKSYADAVQDRDSIYAVIKGSAANHDGHSLTATAPNPAAQEKVILKAWEMADINPEDISYIEAHGTATHIGDPIEIEGLKKAFARYTDKKQFCGIGSVKSNVGHLGNMAGLAGVLKMVLAITHKALPATLHFNCPNPDYNIHDSAMYIVDESCEWKVSSDLRICGISSFGISGTNCHMVLAEAKEKYLLTEEDRARDVFCLSAKNKDSLQWMLAQYIQFIDKGNCNYHDLCYTVNTGKGVYDYRAAIEIDSIEKLRAGLVELRDSWQKHDLDATNIFCSWRNTSPVCGNTEDKLTQMCVDYVKGIPVDWTTYYCEKTYKRLHTPGYSFYPYCCWPDSNGMSAESMIYHTIWEPSAPVNESMKATAENNGNILVIARENSFAAALIGKYRKLGYHVIPAYIYTDDIDTGKVAASENQYIKIKRFLEQIDVESIEKIIILGNVFKPAVSSISELHSFVHYDVKYLLFLASVLESSQNHSIDLYLLSDAVFYITKTEKYLKPENSMLFSIGKSMNLENRYTRFHCIDFDELTSIDTIVCEIESKSGEAWIGYRNGQRYLEKLKPLELSEVHTSANRKLVEHGVYIITGGRGFVGGQIAKQLMQFPQITIVILSRTAAYSEKTLANGAKLVQYPIDVSDEQALSDILETIRITYGEIHGVIHCAGIVRQGKTLKGRYYLEEDILKAKVYGTWLLSRLTHSDPIDFFICCSSFITLIGGMNSCEYAIANSYIDAFTDFRILHGQSALTINWGTFKESVANVNKYNDFIFKPMNTQEAFNIWNTIFNTYRGRLFIGAFNYDIDYFSLKRYVPFLLSERMEKKVKLKNKKGEESVQRILVDVSGRADELYSRTELIIANIIGNHLGIDCMNIDDNFFELGVTSILAVQIEMESKKYNIPLEYKHLYSYPTLRLLSAFMKSGTVNHEADVKPIAQNQVYENNMDAGVIVLQVHPFVKFLYKDCFYNSLMSVMDYYHVDFLQVLTAALPRYIFHQDTKLIDIDYAERESFQELMKKTGLVCDAKEITKNLIENLKSYIDRGIPVILWVDSFYEPFIKDAYNQEHIHHTVVVCGYSDEKKEIYMIDHNQKNTLNYKMQKMSYEQIELAYKENINRFGSQYGKDAFITVEQQHKVENSIKKLKQDYLQLYRNENQSIVEGIANLESFINGIKKLNQSDMVNNLKTNLDIIELFNKIVQSKMAEEYKISRLFEENQAICLQIGNLRELWTKIRALIVKIIYSPNMDTSLVEETVRLLDETLRLEYDYVACLGSILPE